MKLYQHDSPDIYRRAQVRLNRRKRNWRWVRDSELQELANLIQARCERLEFGICHGVRTGRENQILSCLLSMEVVGTDLVGRDGVLEMDFHHRIQEWDGKADFVYSNSLDHSHSPLIALRAWISALRSGGLLLIHFGADHNHHVVDAADCFAASKEEYREMLAKFGSLDEVKIKRRTLFIVRVK